ncbi:MAG: DUF1835 domain-containing protein [Ginsengibacter sp.]
MIHVVFQPSDKEALKKSFELDEYLLGDIVVIEDDYAVGPIKDIFSEHGRVNRSQWWREVLSGTDIESKVDSGEVDDDKKVSNLKSRLDERPEEQLWIWAAQNKHDVSGYYWLISQLKEYQGRVFILYLNNLPFINAKGNIFYPNWLHEIEPKEFIKAKKLARPVTLSEFEIDPDEWNKLCNEEKGVRILEGGKKLMQYDYSFYDGDLKKFITGEWQKVHRLIHTYLSKATHTTGDMFLLWRLKKMLESGVIEAQGLVKNMKDFEVKIKTALATNGEEY